MQSSGKLVFTVSLIILFFNFYSISVLPLNKEILEIIFFIQLFFFLILFSAGFSFEKTLGFYLPELSIYSVLVSICLIAFLYSCFVVNIGSNNSMAYFKILSYFILIYVFVISFSDILFRNEALFEKFLNIILAFAIINSVAAIIFNILGLNKNPIYPSHILGFFSHPNTVSNVFTISIPILFYKYFSRKLSLLIFSALLILFSYCLVFTFSRAGYLGTVIAILLITFFKSKKAFVFTLIIIAIVSVYFIFGIASAKTNSSLARILLIITAVQMIFMSPGSFLWGYGVYNSIDIFKDEKVFIGSFENAVDPHNTILLLGIQFGMIVSFISVTLVFYSCIKALLRVKMLDLQDKSKINLMITLIMGIFFQNMLEDIVVYPEYFIMPLFLTFLGILIKYNTKTKVYNG